VRKLSFLQNVRVPLVDGGHSVVQNMRLLEPLGVSFEGRSLELLFNVSDGDRRFAVDMLRRFGVSSDDFVVGVHAGSGGMEYKRWPLENFICLAEKIVSEFGWKFIFFCGPQEKEVIEAVNELGNKSILFFEGSITETASLIGKCGLFISNDSGLMHVAVSQGIPVIAIFGPTDPKKTDPYTDKKLIVKSKLPCSPCYLPAAHRKFRCIYGHSKCLEEISVEGVLLAIESFLRNRF
jgi:lipopolysaccharide heptosyltransferase II